MNSSVKENDSVLQEIHLCTAQLERPGTPGREKEALSSTALLHFVGPTTSLC